MSEKLTILDGGLGRLLQRIGAPFRQPEWSAAALIESPEYVTKAHQMYIDAGADIITTNTYALVPFHIGEERFQVEANALIKLAGKLAKEVKTSSNRSVQVAGSLPPVFGSYRPDYFQADKAPDILRPLIEKQEENIDFWLAETVSSIEEAKVIFNTVQKYSSKDIWLSYTIRDRGGEDMPSQLRSGESIEDAAKTVTDNGGTALLFNCSQVEEMSPALEIAARHCTLRLGAYANAFGRIKTKHEASTSITPLRDITPEEYLETARQWQTIGASIIGGCCGIMPEHIQELQKLK